MKRVLSISRATILQSRQGVDGLMNIAQLTIVTPDLPVFPSGKYGIKLSSGNEWDISFSKVSPNAPDVANGLSSSAVDRNNAAFEVRRLIASVRPPLKVEAEAHRRKKDMNKSPRDAPVSRKPSIFT